MSLISTPRQIIKLILVGDHYTGKSTIINKYTQQKTSDNTKVEFFTKIFNLNENTIRLNIWDTKGYNAFDNITNTYLREPNAFIILFDITNRNSFNNTQTWLDRLKFYNYNLKNYDYYPILLVGNKRDLETDRKISFNEADTFAKDNRLLYIELSMHDEERIISCINIYLKNILDILYSPQENNDNFNYKNIFDNKNNNEEKKIFLSKSIENISKLDKKYKKDRLCYKCYDCSSSKIVKKNNCSIL